MTISEKLDRVMMDLDQVKNNQAIHGERLEHINSKLDEVRSTVYGSGNDGIKVDVDRLVVFKGMVCWFLAAIILASIAVIGKVVYSSLVT